MLVNAGHLTTYNFCHKLGHSQEEELGELYAYLLLNVTHVLVEGTPQPSLTLSSLWQCI